MNWTNLFQRSSTYAGISLIVAGLGSIFADGDIMGGIESIVAGLGLIALRSGQKTADSKAARAISISMKG